MAVPFLLHCAVVGGAVLVCLRTCRTGSLESTALTVFYSLCLGMLVNMAGLFALGIAGALHGAAVAGLGLLLVVVAAATLRWRGPGTVGQFRVRRPRSGVTWLECAVLFVIFLLCIAVSLHPPGHWDDTMYQLPLARHYVEQQGIVLQEYLRFPLFPQNFNLLFALGIMLGDALPAGPSPLWQFGAPEVFAQVFATLPLFVMALGLWGASHRYLGTGAPGLLAGLTLFMIGPVKSTLGFAYIDNGLALYCLAASLVVAQMAARLSKDGGLTAENTSENTAEALPQSSMSSLAFLAGLLAGGACGTKYFGVVFAAWLGVVIVLMIALQRRDIARGVPVGSRSSVTATLRAAVLYAAGIVLTGSAWYIRSYLISGDPAHPAGASIFGFFLWNEGDLAFQYSEQGEHGVGRNPLMFPAALLEAGVLLWLPAFVGLLLRRVPAPIRALQAAFLGYMLFWFFVSQVPRYLGPVYGLGGFLAFYALFRAWQWAIAAAAGRAFIGRFLNDQDGTSRLAKTAWPTAIVLIVAVGYAADRGIKYGKEYLNAEDVLQTNPGYTLYQQANAHIAELGPRLVQVGFENGIYFFKGTVIGDWFGTGRYRDTLECERLPCPLPPAANLQAILEQHDARMLLLNRAQVVDLNAGVLQEPGWRVLATDDQGMFLTWRPQ